MLFNDVRRGLLLAGVFAAVSCNAPPVSEDDGTISEARIRDLNAPLPEMLVRDLGGDETLLADWLGDSLTIVSAWAEWCIPCLAEIPDLIAFDSEWRGRGVRLLGLAVQSRDSARLSEVIEATGISYPVLVGGDLYWAWNTLRISGIPSTIFIDRWGIVRRLFIGGVTGEQLAAATRGFLQE